MTRWRTGRKVLRTVYEQHGPEPSDDDTLIGVLDHPHQAALAVAAVNAVADKEFGTVQVTAVLPSLMECPVTGCKHPRVATPRQLIEHWTNEHASVLEHQARQLEESRNYYRREFTELGPWLADLLRNGWTGDEMVSAIHAHMTLILQRAPERR